LSIAVGRVGGVRRVDAAAVAVVCVCFVYRYAVSGDGFPHIRARADLDNPVARAALAVEAVTRAATVIVVATTVARHVAAVERDAARG
jgi:hypothetical protein